MTMYWFSTVRILRSKMHGQDNRPGLRAWSVFKNSPWEFENPPPKREDSERNSTQTEPRMELTTFGEFINFAVMNSLNCRKETSLINGKTVGK